MSTPNTPDEQPRFGQRSPNWTPEPTPGNRAGQEQTGQAGETPWGQYGTRSGQSASGTPWPKYGETAPQSGTPTQGQQPAAQATPGQGGQYGQASPSPQNPQGYQGPQIPPTPQGWQQPYAGPVSGPVSLPSRAGAVVLIVLGVVVATVIAFATFIGVALSGMNIQQLLDSATTVTSGDTVTVDDSGSYMVADSQGSKLSCSLTSSSGDAVQLQDVPGNSSMVMGSNIPAGTYILDCQTTGNASLVALSGVDANQMTGAAMRGFAWGTALGLIGIAMVIGGIVWLVGINRRRSDLQRQAWQGGPTRY